MTSRQARTLIAALLLPLSLAGIAVTLVTLFFFALPNVGDLRGCMTASMNQVKLCPSDPTYARLPQIAPELMDAVVASEDASFYFHNGFDWHEIRASFSKNLNSGGFKRGGSTISQQLIKNAFLTKEKSLFRKLREAVLTVSLERNLSKKEILERYLNVVEFGKDLYGVYAASHRYFQRDPAELNLLQSVFLAFLLPNPKEYSKSYFNGALTPFAKKSVTMLLHRLAAFHKISDETLQRALAHIDEFPWLGISRQELLSPATILPGATTDEQIHEVLEKEPAPPEPEPTESEGSSPDSDSGWD